MSYIYDEISPADMARRAEEFDRLDELGGVQGIHALHEWLTEFAEETGPIELDIISLCCAWAHYDSLMDAAIEYNHDDTMADLCRELDGRPGDAADIYERILDWFRDRTTVLELDNDAGYLIGEF